MKKLLLCFINILIICSLFGQGESIFNARIIHEIRFTTFLPNTWDTIVSNYPESEYVPVNVNIDGTRLDSVGLRIKGNRLNAFADRPKYESLKLDINEFVSGQKYDGLKKLNLKNRNLVANHLMYKLTSDNSIPSCRTSFAKVYIDEEYIGSYIIIEQIDKTYLKNTFNNKNGNLYKASGKGGNLTYLGTDVTRYYHPYEKKTNKTENNYSDLVNLLNFINNSSNAEFENNIENHLDFDKFVKALAIEMIGSKADAFYDPGRNYYLYNNPQSSRFEYIVDDFDFTMESADGFDLNFEYLASSDAPFAGSPLLDQILESNTLKSRYYQAVCNILNNSFRDLLSELDTVDNLAQQNNFELYDLLDVNNNTGTIRDYINDRVSVINTQLENNRYSCIVSTETELTSSSAISIFPNPFSTQLTINHMISDALEYKLYNSTGTLIVTDIIPSNNTLNLGHLSSGLYYLDILSPKSTSTFKIVKTD